MFDKNNSEMIEPKYYELTLLNIKLLHNIMNKEYIRWSKIKELIENKIQSIREQEKGIDDPITLSFLQVHEEILQKLKNDIQDNIIRESEIKNENE
ncbi:MAG: hypothetical protein ACLFVB_03510 [Thermoplasmata archaeon]